MFSMTMQQDAQAASEDWQRLVIERARSDPAYFDPLYRHYFPRIYNYCVRRVGNPENAEDVCSTIFTRTLTSLHTYKGGSLAAWIFSIAHNAVANHLRDRRPQVSIDAEAQQLPDLTEGTLERMIRTEQIDLVTQLIAGLPDDQRELLALRIAGELSSKEIGAVLGKSEGAVRTALHRVVQQLRLAYEQEQAE